MVNDTKENVLRLTRVIAIFMDGKETETDLFLFNYDPCEHYSCYYHGERQSLRREYKEPQPCSLKIEDLKYHLSYDWLAPVCSKLNRKFTENDEIFTIYKEQKWHSQYLEICNMATFSHPSQCFELVAHFVMKYNATVERINYLKTKNT